MTKVRTSQQARSQAREISTWWRANRPAAPTLFEDELEQVLDLLRIAPESGILLPRPVELKVRRALLTRSRYCVYYTYDSRKDLVRVLAVWSAVRGGPPSLTGT